MNLPNKITIARILLIPIFLILMLSPFHWGSLDVNGHLLPISHLIATIIFAFASTTDWVDGYLARKYGLVTNFGKFLDPLADKLLVSAALIVLVELTYIPSWMVIVIISREFAVTGLRLLLAGEGEVVAANLMGKIKTTLQLVAISVLLLHNLPFEIYGYEVGTWLMYGAVILTLWSGIEYFYLNRHVFQENRKKAL